ncbi:MAG: hypothetical protein MK132_10310 [Lentisphaerales bacterium]|nr:hypothetical protein [Lentisphaerales bacterium]
MTNPYLGDFTGDDRVPVAHCPIDEAPLNPLFSGETTYDAIGSSYALNSRHPGQGLKYDGNADIGKYTGVKATAITTPPSQMVIIMEVNA